MGGSHNLLLWFLPVRGDHVTNTATESGFNSAVHLAWGDVGMDNSTPPTKIRVVLRRSKTDQFGRGVAVWIGETRDEVCPVRAVMEYTARRGTAAGPFFRLENGIPLTKSRFVQKVRDVLTQAGISQTGYSGHSFRIGAASAAAEAGLEDSVIQALGRWSSSAFLWYIRITHQQLSCHTAALAGQGSTRN